MELTTEFGWLFAVGFVAQLVDGAIGMGYGLTASAFLATLGIPPVVASATVHAAEVATSGVSSLSHAWFRNLDRRIFLSLVLPGVAGGIVGAALLSRVPTDVIRPFVWAYLAITSIVVLGRALLRRPPLEVAAPGPALGGTAGFLDAIGGGGWGALTTSTLIARGVPARYAIGTANAAEFFVSLAISLTFWVHLEALRFDLVVALILGGAVAAPIAAWITRHVPPRVAATGVGATALALAAGGLLRSLG